VEDIAHFFSPIDIEGITEFPENTLGTSIRKYISGKNFPELKGIHLAIIGVEEERRAVNNEGCGGAADAIRPSHPSDAHAGPRAGLRVRRIGVASERRPAS